MTTLEEYRAEQSELAELARREDAERRRARREADEARKAKLPQVRYEPSVGADEPFVIVPAGTRLWAYDPADDRVFLAAVSGQRLRPGYAKKLGLS